MAADFDESDTPPPMLFDPSRADDPRSRQWAQREVEYVTKIATLQAENGKLRLENARLKLEIRRRLRGATEEKEVK